MFQKVNLIFNKKFVGLNKFIYLFDLKYLFLEKFNDINNVLNIILLIIYSFFKNFCFIDYTNEFS